MDMMMKQIPILLWGLLLPFSILQAQAVQGEITDSKQLPIEGATVVGLDAKDSSFVQGTVTREQGHFTLPLRHNGSYLLKTSAVGYKTRYIPFSITDTETAKLSRILMEEDSYALSGITVTAQKVPVEMKAGKNGLQPLGYHLGYTRQSVRRIETDARRANSKQRQYSVGRTRRHQRTDEWKDNLSERRNADKLLAKYPGVDSGENRTDKQSVLPSRCSRKNGSDKH